MPRILSRAALLTTLIGLACSSAAHAQPPGAPWYVGVWPVDAQTVLTVRATTGQEVRSGRRGMRHGRRVPLVVDDEATVHFDIEASSDFAKRWVLDRDGREVRIEEWTRRGPDGTAFLLLRTVVLTRSEPSLP